MEKTNMKTNHLIAVALLSAAVCAGGCTKTVKITVMNHTDVSRQLQLTVPDGTTTLGAVGPNSTMSSTLKVQTSDLPASCNLSAGGGASQSFTVTDDSPSAWWFHVTADGKMVGPLGKNDIHTETEDRGKIEIRSDPKMLLK
jgi:hypothetical protein